MEVRHKGHFEALALDTCHCSTQGMHPITAWQDAHAAAGNDTVLRQMEHLKIDFNTLEASSSGEGALGFSEVGERCSTKSSSSSGPSATILLNCSRIPVFALFALPLPFLKFCISFSFATKIFRLLLQNCDPIQNRQKMPPFICLTLHGYSKREYLYRYLSNFLKNGARNIKLIGEAKLSAYQLKTNSIPLFSLSEY